MKFAKNCVFLVDSAIEISIALGKFLEIPLGALAPRGISKKFPRGEENFWANPLKKRNFSYEFPLDSAISITNSDVLEIIREIGKF